MRRLKKLSIIALLARFGFIFATRYGTDGTAKSREHKRFQAPAYAAKVLKAFAQQVQLMSVWMLADRTYGQLEPLAKTADDHASLVHARSWIYWYIRRARAESPQPHKV
jgi:hypothetical protein